jgi:hypothetical protein
MNWRAITSAVGQVCFSVYHASQQAIDLAREAFSPQGAERSFLAVSEASRSYLKDLSIHPAAWFNPLTLPMAPLDIFSRMKTRDQERVLLQAGMIGIGGWIPGVLPISPLLEGMSSFISGTAEGVRSTEGLVRGLNPFARGGHLISPVGTPGLESFRGRD